MARKNEPQQKGKKKDINNNNSKDKKNTNTLNNQKEEQTQVNLLEDKTNSIIDYLPSESQETRFNFWKTVLIDNILKKKLQDHDSSIFSINTEIIKSNENKKETNNQQIKTENLKLEKIDLKTDPNKNNEDIRNEEDNNENNNASNFLINHLKSELLQLISTPQIPQTDLNKHLEWLSNHGKIIILYEKWPSHIVGENTTAFGFKVKDRGEKEDLHYLKNDVLRRDCPRGIVYVSQKMNIVKGKQVGPESDFLSCSIFGVRKFFAKKSEDNSRKAISQTLEDGKYTYIVPTTKANGDMCQVSVFQKKDSLNQPEKTGEIIWIVGSKNRKIAVRNKNDIGDYFKETCYVEHANKMAFLFFDYLEKMGPEKSKQLKYFLNESSLTINFEFESQEMQHVVPLKETKLVLIGLTGKNVKAFQGIHPFLSACIAQYFGFPSVFDWDNLKIYPKKDLSSVCEVKAKSWNSEGSVLVLLDKEMKTLDLVKVKSWQYTLLRALREKLKKSKEISPSYSINIFQRFEELAISMKMDSNFLESFKKIINLFINWISKDNYGKRLVLVQKSFPEGWLRFLQECHLPEDSSILDLKLEGLEPPKAIAPLSVSKSLNKNNNNNNQNNINQTKKKKKKKKKGKN